MKQQLFSVSASGHERLLLAGNPAQALTWCIDNDTTIAEADAIVVQRRTDLVKVDGESPKRPALPRAARRSAPAKRIPPPMPKKRAKAAKPGKGAGIPEGMVLVSDLATEHRITTEGMKQRLTNAGVHTQRIAGMHGNPTAVKEKAARAALEKLATEKPRERESKPVKRDPRSGHNKPPEAELRKLAVAKPESSPHGPTGPADKFMRIEQVAKSLRMDEGDVAKIKKDGNVGGGFGWVNVTQLEAYMASDEYKQRNS